MTAYSEFLASKRRLPPSSGVPCEPAAVHPGLFDFQRHIAAWAVRRGRAAVWADTGLGKSRIQVEWLRTVLAAGGRGLILAPLAVTAQTVREAEAIGVRATYVRNADEAAVALTDPADADQRIVICNYERLEQLDPAVFDAVVLDECFAPGTLIDTPFGRVPIEDLRPGDEIHNAAGVDTVADIHRREVPYVVSVTAAGQRIVSSPNHPYFTQRGWVGAQDLEPGDSVLRTAEALRLVRQDVHPGTPVVAQERTSTVLQSVLLSEMADGATGERGEGSHSGSGSQAWPEQGSMAGRRVRAGSSRDRADRGVESHYTSRGPGENLPPLEVDRPRTFRAWGQWPWLDRATATDAGCTWSDLGSGVRFVTGPTDSRISHALQARLGAARTSSRYRTGWQHAPQPSHPRREERREGGFARVDGVEVLERGDHRLDGIRDADGRLRFYDLGATRHPSYSTAGLLVHNSSILKAYSGATKRALVAAFAGTRYRLCCTATPAPNDLEELCNHADFLGVMSPQEMRSTFFIADSRGEFMRYRLKGHAKQAFYDWLASWAIACRRPSDLGFDDDGYVLPPLTIDDHLIETGWAADGELFTPRLEGITQRAQVRRDTVAARTTAAAELVLAEPDERWLVWCGTNDEAVRMTAALAELGAVNVQGSDHPEVKAAALLDFADGTLPVLVTKCEIAAYGLNFQSCARMVFVGLSDSYEKYYQAIRRCYRFGQARPVDVHVVLADAESVIAQNVRAKERLAAATTEGLVVAIAEQNRRELFAGTSKGDEFTPTRPLTLPAWLTSEETPA